MVTSKVSSHTLHLSFARVSLYRTGQYSLHGSWFPPINRQAGRQALSIHWALLIWRVLWLCNFSFLLLVEHAWMTTGWLLIILVAYLVRYGIDRFTEAAFKTPCMFHDFKDVRAKGRKTTITKCMFCSWFCVNSGITAHIRLQNVPKKGQAIRQRSFWML